MNDGTTVKERLVAYLNYKNISIREFQKVIGASVSYVHNINLGSIGHQKQKKIIESYPDLSLSWLMTGDGEMIRPEVETSSNHSSSTPVEYSIPLLPMSAHAGRLMNFSAEGVDRLSCEMIVSPIKDADLAMTITGESMAPEYTNGSRVLIKKINETAFIDWGRTYVLDTVNGVVIKNIYPSEKEGCIKCVSINPDYPSYEIAFSDIFGMYRVLMCLSLK